VFWINLPVAAVVLLIAARHVPESRAEAGAAHFDIPGAVLGALGLGAATWALIAAGDRGASLVVVAAAVAGILGLGAFLLVEHGARAPLVPLGLFESRQFSGVNLVTFVVYAGMSVLFFLLVVYLQNVAGYSPIRAGTALIPVTLLMLTLSARAGALAERIGPRRLMTIGPLAMAVGMLLLSRIGEKVSYATHVLPGVIVFGLGLSATVAPLTATVLAAVDPRNAGIASGVNNAVARTAALLGVAVLPVASGLSGDAFRDAVRFHRGFGISMTLSAALMVVGGTLAWIAIRDKSATGKPACNQRQVSRHTFCAIDGPPLEPASRDLNVPS